MIRFILFTLFISSNLFGNLLKPEDGHELNYIHVLFEWEQEPDAVAYQIEISTDSNFLSIIVSQIDSSLIYIEKEMIDWETTYYWRVAPLYQNSNSGEYIDTQMFSTGGTISNAEATIFDENSYSEGLTVFGAFYDYYSAIIDMNGNEIWNTGEQPIIYYNTDYYGQYYGCQYIAGQSDGNYYNGVKYSLDNEVIWAEPSEEFNHHEIIELPNGNFLGIVEVEQAVPVPIGPWTETCNTFYPGLCDGVIPFFTWFGDKIVEWDKESHEMIWEWNFFDHISTADYDNENGTWFDAFIATPQRYDWTHANALWFDETESAVYVSIRHLSRIVKINYPSGEIIWSMGEEMPSGDVGFGHDLGINFQHSLQILENGNVITFDNGNSSNSSRALEIQINEGGTDYSADIVWEHNLTEELYGSFSGNVQKLENSNYLITTIGESGTAVEISSEHENIWEAKYHLSEPLGAVYRSNRISGLYPVTYSIIKPSIMVQGEEEILSMNIGENTLEFIIVNDGEKTETYEYSFMDKSGCFSDDSNSITLSPGENRVLFFDGVVTIENQYYNFEFTITPIHRQDLMKKICYPSCGNIKVYPGDTDNNGVVDIYDIIPIGLYFNEWGHPRVTTSFNWQEYEVSPWDSISVTYADANGDGLVDGRDVIGIGINWEKSHEVSGRIYSFEFDDDLLYKEKYRENFYQLYYSLNGTSEVINNIRNALGKILNLEFPQSITLYQNYPNPFNSNTTITFNLEKGDNISLTVHDLLGHTIKSLFINKYYDAGDYKINFDAMELSSGIYFSKLETSSSSIQKKLVLIK